MINTKIDCDCKGEGIVNGWVSPDGDYDFDYCDCNICVANAFDIAMISTNPETLCATHRAEWELEKTYND